MKGGKFYISRDIVLGKLDDSFVDVLKIMEFVPVRVELLAECDDFEYIGYSHLFDDFPIGHRYPTYDIQTTNDVDDNGVVTVADVRAIRRE